MRIIWAIAGWTMFLFYGLLHWIVGLATRCLLLPIRFTDCRMKGHDWFWLGNGFFGFAAPRKPLMCKRCKKLGDWDQADSHKS